jgi:hypothetical protein
MARVAHIIGNGDHSHLYKSRNRKGLKLTCNLPPFTVPDYYATTIVDFKMMRAITRGEILVPGYWIIGMRPKIWMEKNPGFYMQVAKQVKEIYTDLPSYCPNYTDFNCGHFAAHYAANKLKADIIHLYGFDSCFDFNLRSVSDFYQHSDRGNMNNNRLASNWRPVWSGMFKEFPNTEFVFHHVHDNYKMKVSDNVRTELYTKKDMKNVSSY